MKSTGANMTNATQLNLQLVVDPAGAKPIKDISENSGYNFYGKLKQTVIDQFVKDYGSKNSGPIDLKQFDIDAKYAQDALSSLPESVLAVEIPKVIVMHIDGAGSLPPHIDYDTTCGINYYVETAGAKQELVFYEFKNPFCDPVDPTAFLLKNLNEIECYEPKPGEFWMINNQQPHGVRVVGEGQATRRVISFDFKKTSYAQIKNLMKRAGAI